MTKKQIDNLALYISICAERGELKEVTKKVNDLLKLYFDLYIIQDYDKVQALRVKIFDKAIKLYREHNRLA